MFELPGYVDLFGCDLVALVPGVPIECWDDVPAVSTDYRAARDLIVARLPALLEPATLTCR